MADASSPARSIRLRHCSRLLGLVGCSPTQSASSPNTATDESEAAASPSQSPWDGALLCDNFEHHTVGQAPPSPSIDATGQSGAMVTFSTQRALSGSKSVHVRESVGQSYRRGCFGVQGAAVFPAASQQLYGRAMVWLEEAPTVSPGNPPVHWTLVQGEGPSADNQFSALYQFGGQHQQGTGLMANGETTESTSTDCWQPSRRRFSVQQGVCIQWHFSASAHEMQLWVDGQPVDDLHIAQARPLDPATDSYPGDGPSGCVGHDLSDPWLAPTHFDRLYLGWERYQEPTNDSNTWFDDVAVSLQPIACAPGEQ